MKYEVSIHTKRLHIRSLKETDLDRFYIYRSNPEVALYQGWDVMNKEACKGFIKRQSGKLLGEPMQWVQYGIESSNENYLIGDCAIRLKSDTKIAEIGISISPIEQSKGYATEATLGILKYLFDTLHLHRVEIITDAENEAAIRTLKKIGFRQEAHFIENIFFNGKWGSEFQFALLKREWDGK